MNGQSLGLLVALAVSSAAGAAPAPAEPWGTIKGQFVIETSDGKLPPIRELLVRRDCEHCLSKGPIRDETYVVDPKTKGVRWVMVWITPEKDGVADHKTNPKIHPSLVPIKEKQVVFDTPVCRFEPHVAVLRIGQELVIKQSSPIAHAAKIHSLLAHGPNQITVLPPGGKPLSIPAEKWKPYHLPAFISCSIHPWMKAYLFVLGHPYFAVSKEDGTFEIKNVPAGKLRILMWHENIGWLHERQPGKRGDIGQGINVKAGQTLDLGKISVKYED